MRIELIDENQKRYIIKINDFVAIKIKTSKNKWLDVMDCYSDEKTKQDCIIEIWEKEVKK